LKNVEPPRTPSPSTALESDKKKEEDEVEAAGDKVASDLPQYSDSHEKAGPDNKNKNRRALAKAEKAPLLNGLESDPTTQEYNASATNDEYILGAKAAQSGDSQFRFGSGASSTFDYCRTRLGGTSYSFTRRCAGV
jgi:hypothetical protein